MKLIIDLIFVAILVICGWTGYKKGIIMGIGGLAVIIVSLYGGHLLSTTFSYEVIPALKPFASGYLETKLETSLYDMLGYEPDENGSYNVEYSAADLFEQNPDLRIPAAKSAYRQLGVYSSTAEQMAHEALEYSETNSVSLSTGVVQIFCERFTYYVGVILGFLLIAIALTVVGNLLNLSFRFPCLDIINEIGGTVIGVLTGVCFCALLAWAFRFTGKLFSEDTLETTKLASWFLEKDYVYKWLQF